MRKTIRKRQLLRIHRKGEKMKKRTRVRKNKDAKIFRKTAVRTKLINNEKVVPRGGIRL